MWRKNAKWLEFRSAGDAFRAMRDRAQQAIAEGDRQGLNLRTLRVRLRDEAGNALFEGTLEGAANVQFGSDARARSITDMQSFDGLDLLPTPRLQSLTERLGKVEAQLKDRDLEIDLLRTRNQQLEALIHLCSDVFYCMSADWSEMRALTGKPFIADTRVPKRNWLETYIPRDEQGLVADRVHRSISTRCVFSLEHRVFRADGSIGWTRSRAVPVFDTDGSLKEWVGSADDITDRVKEPRGS